MVVKITEYITLTNMDDVLNNIAVKIVDNINLAKCLKFNSTDALSKNLTDDERYALYDQDSEDVRVIFRPFNNDTITDTRSELRLYYATFVPDGMQFAKVQIGFDIIVHNSLWRLDGGKQRPTTMFKEIINTLNGQDVKGVGELFFKDSSCVLRAFNNTFTGYSFSMRTRSV